MDFSTPKEAKKLSNQDYLIESKAICLSSFIDTFNQKFSGKQFDYYLKSLKPKAQNKQAKKTKLQQLKKSQAQTYQKKTINQIVSYLSKNLSPLIQKLKINSTNMTPLGQNQVYSEVFWQKFIKKINQLMNILFVLALDSLGEKASEKEIKEYVFQLVIQYQLKKIIYDQNIKPEEYFRHIIKDQKEEFMFNCHMVFRQIMQKEDINVLKKYISDLKLRADQMEKMDKCSIPILYRLLAKIQYEIEYLHDLVKYSKENAKKSQKNKKQNNLSLQQKKYLDELKEDKQKIQSRMQKLKKTQIYKSYQIDQENDVSKRNAYNYYMAAIMKQIGNQLFSNQQCLQYLLGVDLKNMGASRNDYMGKTAHISFQYPPNKQSFIELLEFILKDMKLMDKKMQILQLMKNY